MLIVKETYQTYQKEKIDHKSIKLNFKYVYNSLIVFEMEAQI